MEYLEKYDSFENLCRLQIEHSYNEWVLVCGFGGVDESLK